jgi:hypothetical protein
LGHRGTQESLGFIDVFYIIQENWKSRTASEIDRFNKEYLALSSPRRKEIDREAAEMKERLAAEGITVDDSAGLRQAAAKTNRMSKQYDRDEMRARHWKWTRSLADKRYALQSQHRSAVS